MNYLFYNELADSGKNKDVVDKIQEELKTNLNGEVESKSVINLDVDKTIKSLKVNDKVVLLGGDGTLNHFVNSIDLDKKLPCKFYLYPYGTGNDFLNDVKEKQDPVTHLVELNEYIQDLPVIEVKGKTYRFINGIGYGVDGECCKKADELKAQGKTDINYGKITVGLIFKGYVAPNAIVKVDGKEVGKFKKVYISAAMNGKYYGGGMKVAPDQVRGSKLITSVVIYGTGKIGVITIFPNLFKGTHVKDKKHCFVAQGKEIEVSFDRPTALQIDGEVVSDVTSYKAYIK